MVNIHEVKKGNIYGESYTVKKNTYSERVKVGNIYWAKLVMIWWYILILRSNIH